MLRIGQGFDLHKFTPDKPLILGGVNIPHNRGLAGHSDADVLIHAIIDAILGALSLGDIGRWFPDNDPKYKGIDSTLLLKEVLNHNEVKQWQLVNLDCTILTEHPKITPHAENISKSLTTLLDCTIKQVSVKASTMEKTGSIGSGEAMAVTCVILLQKK